MQAKWHPWRDLCMKDTQKWLDDFHLNVCIDSDSKTTIKKNESGKKKGSECLKSVPRIPAPHEWHTHARFTCTLVVLGYSTTTTGKGLGQTRDSAELPFKECSGIKNKTNRNKTKQKNPNQNPLPSLWGFYTVFFLTTITSHASYTNKKSLDSGGQKSLSIFIYFERFQFFSGLMNTHLAFHFSWATAITWYKQKSSCMLKHYKTYKKPHAIHFVGIICKAS